MDEAGIKFLDKIFNDLYMSDIVQHTKENTDKRTDAIRKYLERLERLHSFADTEERKQYVLDMYFDKYVIKPENIDERSIPAGDTKESIIEKQQKGLSAWINYLTDPSTPYPTWARYWAFQGVRKMGSYDESKKKYLKRNDKTVANYPFPDPAALAKTMEVITRLVNGQEIDDITELRLSKTDSFSKIYTIFEQQQKEQILADSSVEGEWIKYDQGDREAAKRLSSSINNFDTKWCTSSEGVAIKQVCGPYSDAPEGGDFYVYYTKDAEGNYKVPRIAIRCVGHDNIGEIRGVAEGQNLENGLDTVLEQKLREMTFMKPEAIDKALDTVQGLRELTGIGIKTENREALTDLEMRDLYFKKFGFGWIQDPRVEKIRNKRDILFDIDTIKDEKIKMEFILKLKKPATPKQIEFLEKNISLVNELIDEDSHVIDSIPKQFLDNHQELIKKAMATYKEAVLLGNKGFLEENINEVYDLVSKDGLSLRKMDKEFINNHSELIEMGSRTCDYAPAFFNSEAIEKNMGIVFEKIKTTRGNLVSSLPSDFLMNHPDVLLETANINGQMILHSSVPFEWIYENHPEIIKASATTFPSVVESLPKDYKEAHMDIVAESLKSSIRQTNQVVIHHDILDNHPEVIAQVAKEEPKIFSNLSNEYLSKNIPMVKETLAEDPSAISYMRTSFMVEHPEFLVESIGKVDLEDEKMQTFYQEKKETINQILSSKKEWKPYLSKVEMAQKKQNKQVKNKKRNKVHNVNKKLKSNKLFNGLKEKIFKKKTTEKRKPVYKSDKTYRSSSSLMEMRQRINNKKNSKSGKTL